MLFLRLSSAALVLIAFCFTSSLQAVPNDLALRLEQLLSDPAHDDRLNELDIIPDKEVFYYPKSSHRRTEQDAKAAAKNDTQVSRDGKGDNADSDDMKSEVKVVNFPNGRAVIVTAHSSSLGGGEDEDHSVEAIGTLMHSMISGMFNFMEDTLRQLRVFK